MKTFGPAEYIWRIQSMLGQDILSWHLRESRLRKKFRKNRMRSMRLGMRRMKRRIRMRRRKTDPLLLVLLKRAKRIVLLLENFSLGLP